MRKLLTLLLLGGITTAGFSQISYQLVTKPKNSSIPDTVIRRYKDELKKNQVPNYGIPNAILVKPQPNTYIGNNGQGFDMYESPIDNMTIAKPDTSSGFNMPVLKFTTPEKIVNSQTFNMPGLKEYIEQKKPKDTMAAKPWQPKIYRVPKK